jgi:hypothetical protein
MKKISQFLFLLFTLSFVIACEDSGSSGNNGITEPVPSAVAVTSAQASIAYTGWTDAEALVTDEDGSALEGIDVTLSQSGSYLTFEPASGTTDEDGKFKFTIKTASSMPEPASDVTTQFTARVDDELSDTASLTIRPIPDKLPWDEDAEAIFRASLMPGISDRSIIVTLPQDADITMNEATLLDGSVTAEVYGNYLELGFTGETTLAAGSHTAIVPFMIDGVYTPVKYAVIISDGTEVNPYPVRGLSDLELIVGSNLEKSYILENDIDMGAVNWAGIGRYKQNGDNAPFTGVFEGNGHSIINFNVAYDTDEGSGYPYARGFFAYIDNAIIKNIHITGTMEVMPITTRTASAGMLVGQMDGTDALIENCSTGGTIEASTSATSYSGGIVGIMNSGTINSSFSTVSIITKDCAGGVVGEAAGGVIKNCYSTGELNIGIITNTNTYIGGIAGYSRIAATIDSCYATGSIVSKSRAAGIAIGNINANNPIVKNSVALNPSLIGANTYIARISAGRDTDNAAANTGQENNYAFDEMSLSLTGTGSTYTPTAASTRNAIHGEDLALSAITASFFTTAPEDTSMQGVGWDMDIWDFNWADRGYKLPILKNHRAEAQKNQTMPAHLAN